MTNRFCTNKQTNDKQNMIIPLKMCSKPRTINCFVVCKKLTSPISISLDSKERIFSCCSPFILMLAKFAWLGSESSRNILCSTTSLQKRTGNRRGEYITITYTLKNVDKDSSSLYFHIKFRD